MAKQEKITVNQFLDIIDQLVLDDLDELEHREEARVLAQSIINQSWANLNPSPADYECEEV